MKAALVSLLAASLLADPSLAQDADDDWDVVRDRRGRAEMAHLQFSNGLTIMVQCKDGSLDAMVGGLPPAGPTLNRMVFRERPLELRFRGEEDRRQSWAVGTDDTLAVSLLPAPFARKLRQGGTFELRVPEAGSEGRAATFQVDLPPSALSIDEVLTACRRPLVDARDELLDEAGPTGLPQPLRFRNQTVAPVRTTDVVSGFAVISCLTRTDGRLGDCVVESEHPRGTSAVRVGLDSARRWRVEVGGQPDAPVPVARIHFTVSVMAE